MNEDRMNPESKRLAEVWKKSQDLTAKARTMSVNIDLMNRSTPKQSQPKTRPRPMKELTPSMPKIKQPQKKEPDQKRKGRKAFTLSEIQKRYKEANTALISRIKSNRFADVPDIQVR